MQTVLKNTRLTITFVHSLGGTGVFLFLVCCCSSGGITPVERPRSQASKGMHIQILYKYSD